MYRVSFGMDETIPKKTSFRNSAGVVRRGDLKSSVPSMHGFESHLLRPLFVRHITIPMQ